MPLPGRAFSWQQEVQDRILDWYQCNFEEIVEALIRPERSHVSDKCDTHSKDYSCFQITGIPPTGVRGCSFHDLEKEDFIAYVLASLTSLKCHAVSHMEVILLDSILWRSIMITNSMRERHAFMMMWLLLAARHSSRTHTRDDFINHLIVLGKMEDAELRSDAFATVNWARSGEHLGRRIRGWWAHDPEYKGRFVRFPTHVHGKPDAEVGDCACGSTVWSSLPVPALRTWGLVDLKQCKAEPRFCCYRVRDYSFFSW